MQTHVTNYQIPHFRALRIFLRIKHKVKLASLMLHQIQKNYKKRQKPKGEKTTKQTSQGRENHNSLPALISMLNGKLACILSSSFHFFIQKSYFQVFLGSVKPLQCSQIYIWVLVFFNPIRFLVGILASFQNFFSWVCLQFVFNWDCFCWY